MLTYPPKAKHPIHIYQADYNRLNMGEYLNDTIIDFYLKFLIQNVIPDPERFHIFGTFFYT
jgi:Ulp1 family protease